jgi:hypothetical protein
VPACPDRPDEPLDDEALDDAGLPDPGRADEEPRGPPLREPSRDAPVELPRGPLDGPPFDDPPLDGPPLDGPPLDGPRFDDAPCVPFDAGRDEPLPDGRDDERSEDSAMAMHPTGTSHRLPTVTVSKGTADDLGENDEWTPFRGPIL